MIACSVSGAEFGSVLVQCILPFPLLTTGAMFDIWILPFDCYCCHVQSPLHAEELFPCHCKYKHTGFADGAHAGPSTSCEPASRRPPTAEFSPRHTSRPPHQHLEPRLPEGREGLPGEQLHAAGHLAPVVEEEGSTGRAVVRHRPAEVGEPGLASTEPVAGDVERQHLRPGVRIPHAAPGARALVATSQRRRWPRRTPRRR
jgi:hypothetical protein